MIDSMRRGGDNDDDRHHRRIPCFEDIDKARWKRYYSDDDDEVDLDQPRSVLEALHIARCDSIIQYDPKKDARVFTRVCNINIAGFDLDRECQYGYSIYNNFVDFIVLLDRFPIS
jgi:hypothetical protein